MYKSSASTSRMLQGTLISRLWVSSEVLAWPVVIPFMLLIVRLSIASLLIRCAFLVPQEVLPCNGRVPGKGNCNAGLQLCHDPYLLPFARRKVPGVPPTSCSCIQLDQARLYNCRNVWIWEESSWHKADGDVAGWKSDGLNKNLCSLCTCFRCSCLPDKSCLTCVLHVHFLLHLRMHIHTCSHIQTYVYNILLYMHTSTLRLIPWRYCCKGYTERSLNHSKHYSGWEFGTGIFFEPIIADGKQAVSESPGFYFGIWWSIGFRRTRAATSCTQTHNEKYWNQLLIQAKIDKQLCV